MKKYTIGFLAVLICVFSVMQETVSAQESLSDRGKRQRQERELEKARGIVERDLGRLRLVSDNYYINNNNSDFDPYVPPYQSFRFFGPYSLPARMPFSAFGGLPKNTSEIQSQLEIKDSEISAYKTFLDFPNTGAFKLLSFIDCSIVTEKEDCYKQNSNIRFFGNAYSFREKDHKFFYQADLIKRENIFETSKNANQSVFVNLGDIALENLSLNSAGMDFLVKFKPERKAEKVNEQYEKIAEGIKDGDYEYVKSLPVQENATYALRSVAYKGSFDSPGEIADVIVAFRVTGVDKNGTVTVIWKELSRKDGVKLKN